MSRAAWRRIDPGSGRVPLVVASVASLVALAAPVTPPAAAGEWPQLRGVARDGRASGAGLDGGALDLRLAWSHPLGPGYSGVTVADGVALTLFTDGDRERLVAFDAADGSLLWGYAIGAATRSFNGKPSKPPASTPLVHRGVVYGLGAHGKLFALRVEDGTELWSRHLGGRQPVHGFAASPLLVDVGRGEGPALVIAGGGGDGGHGSAVAAYRRCDGTRLWSHGRGRVAYQSPVEARLAGRRVLLVPGNDVLLGLDPASGRPLFRLRHDADDGDGFTLPVAVPSHDLGGRGDGILLNHRDGAALYRVTRADGRFRLEEAWRSTALGDSYAAPVVHEGHVYGFGGTALRCLGLETGAERWRQRLTGGRGLIVVGDRLVLFAPGGDLVLADASPKGYRERARLSVATGDSYTWPSYADGRVYVRDHRRVAAVDLTATRAAAPAAGGPAPTP